MRKCRTRRCLGECKYVVLRSYGSDSLNTVIGSGSGNNASEHARRDIRSALRVNGNGDGSDGKEKLGEHFFWKDVFGVVKKLK
jgi:hypothetical protein